VFTQLGARCETKDFSKLTTALTTSASSLGGTRIELANYTETLQTAINNLANSLSEIENLIESNQKDLSSVTLRPETNANTLTSATQDFNSNSLQIQEALNKHTEQISIHNTNLQNLSRKIQEYSQIVEDVQQKNSQAFLDLNQIHQSETEAQKNIAVDFSNHKQWNHDCGWKNTLNNLRLIIQPLLVFWLIYPWLNIFQNSHLLLGFNHLIAAMNKFKPCYASG